MTYEGRPFHAVMEIGESATTPYSGRVEVWWAKPGDYRTSVMSAQFRQVKIVNGDRVQEQDEGDYYPRWLENFVLALVDPGPMARNFRGRGDMVMVGAQVTKSCLRRDDRPGGITDHMTWGIVCFRALSQLLWGAQIYSTWLFMKEKPH